MSKNDIKPPINQDKVSQDNNKPDGWFTRFSNYNKLAWKDATPNERILHVGGWALAGLFLTSLFASSLFTVAVGAALFLSVGMSSLGSAVLRRHNSEKPTALMDYLIKNSPHNHKFSGRRLAGLREADRNEILTDNAEIISEQFDRSANSKRDTVVGGYFLTGAALSALAFVAAPGVVVALSAGIGLAIGSLFLGIGASQGRKARELQNQLYENVKAQQKVALAKYASGSSAQNLTLKEFAENQRSIEDAQLNAATQQAARAVKTAAPVVTPMARAKRPATTIGQMSGKNDPAP